MDAVLIRGGQLVDPGNGLNVFRDLLVRKGRVDAIEKPGLLSGKQAQDIVDATGCIVCPGFIDVHVHLREPGQTWKETIATGTAAAAAGGYTSVVAMPNTVPVNDAVASMEWMLDPARGPTVRLYAMPAVTVGSMGAELTDFEALARAGAVGFTDDGKPVLDVRLMREALLRAGRLGLVVSQHAEDTRMSPSSGIHDGAVAFRLGLRGMSSESEASIVERDIGLVRSILAREKVQGRLHVQHVSTARAIAAVRAAKAEGLDVTCEVAPHHFTLTEDALAEFDTNCKMNPPLRTEADRMALIAGLLDGTVDCIATDHAPHARHEKEVEFASAPNGITGLETALGLAMRVLVGEHGMPLPRLVALLASGPAQVAGLPGGSLGVGSPADITVFDAGAAWRYDVAATKSKSRNTPFDGVEMLGRIKAVLVGGERVG